MPFEHPSFEELADTEATNQAELVRDRNLAKYDQLIFQSDDPNYPEDAERPWPQREAFHAFLADLHRGDLSVKGLLRGLGAQKPEGSGPVHWADMGAGYMVAEQDLHKDPEFAGVQVTGVDLHPLTPETVLADSTTVELDRPADLITAIHHSQYLPDQIAAICNWYNQLASNGVVIVASERNLSSRMEMAGRRMGDIPISQQLLQALDEQGVPYAALAPGRSASPDEYGTLAIRKIPGTKLTSEAVLLDSDQQYGHRTAYYDREMTGPVVRLTAADQ